VTRQLASVHVLPMPMDVSVTNVNEVSSDIQTVGHVSAVDALMNVMIPVVVCHVENSLEESVVKDVPMVITVIRDLVLRFLAIHACVLVDPAVGSNMVTLVDLMLVLTKPSVIVALDTVV